MSILHCRAACRLPREARFPGLPRKCFPGRLRQERPRRRFVVPRGTRAGTLPAQFSSLVVPAPVRFDWFHGRRALTSPMAGNWRPAREGQLECEKGVPD